MVLKREDVELFIVRVWVEAKDSQGRPIDWRCSVEYVLTPKVPTSKRARAVLHRQRRQKLYCKDLTKILRFIRSRTGWKTAKGSS